MVIDKDQIAATSDCDRLLKLSIDYLEEGLK